MSPDRSSPMIHNQGPSTVSCPIIGSLRSSLQGLRTHSELFRIGIFSAIEHDTKTTVPHTIHNLLRSALSDEKDRPIDSASFPLFVAIMATVEADRAGCHDISSTVVEDLLTFHDHVDEGTHEASVEQHLLILGCHIKNDRLLDRCHKILEDPRSNINDLLSWVTMLTDHRHELGRKVHHYLESTGDILLLPGEISYPQWAHQANRFSLDMKKPNWAPIFDHLSPCWQEFAAFDSVLQHGNPINDPRENSRILSVSMSRSMQDYDLLKAFANIPIDAHVGMDLDKFKATRSYAMFLALNKSIPKILPEHHDLIMPSLGALAVNNEYFQGVISRLLGSPS